MTQCDCNIEIVHKEQRWTLVVLLTINAVIFYIECQDLWWDKA